MKKLNIVFLFVIFLQMNESFRVLMYYSNQKSVVFSLLTLGLVAIYCFSNFKLLLDIFKVKLFRLWFHLVCTLPIISILINYGVGNINQTDTLYWIPFTMLFGGLFVACVMLASNPVVKEDWIYKLFFYSIVMSVIGFIIGYVNIGFIRTLGELSSSDQAFVLHDTTEMDKAVGFFGQSNLAALSVVCYFIYVFRARKMATRTVRFYSLMAVLLTGLVFITGSRTSLLLIALIFFLYLPKLLSGAASKGKVSRGSLNRRINVYVIVGTFVILLFCSLFFLSDTLTDMGLGQITKKMQFFTNLFDSSSTPTDGSVSDRVQALKEYWVVLQNNWILGHGPQYRDQLMTNGTFQHVSQNTYVEAWLAFGIGYLVYIVYVFTNTIRYLKEKARAKSYVFDPLKVYLLFFALLAVSVSGLLSIRAIVVTLGFVIGMEVRDKFLVQDITKKERRELRKKKMMELIATT